MKNIHILPTNKRSKLATKDSNNKLEVSEKNTLFVNGFGFTTHNIYITSDEEIKVNDYITDGYLVWKWKDDSSLLGRKKVIVTTDQSLDGVQAIDNEFLEWFVQNSSCEEVEVAKTNKLIDNYADKDEDKWEVKYHIYLPKEEPKQDKIMERFIANAKQETLENKLKSLFWKWQRRQVEYERLAEKHSANEHNCKKFTYKAVATRDCWKELLKLIEDEK